MFGTISFRSIWRKICRYDSGEEILHLLWIFRLYWERSKHCDKIIGAGIESQQYRDMPLRNFIHLRIWRLKIYMRFFPIVKMSVIAGEYHPKQYRIDVTTNDLFICYGAQTMDSLTNRVKIIRFTWFEAYQDEPCRVTSTPVKFKAIDYDGMPFTGTIDVTLYCRRLGAGLKKYRLGRLILEFNKAVFPPDIQACVDVEYDKPTSRGKGDWKGGTHGTYYTTASFKHPYDELLKLGRKCDFSEIELVTGGYNQPKETPIKMTEELQ